MTIEWLDDFPFNREYAKARVTRGWFRKRFANVSRGPGDGWFFVATGARVGWWLEGRLDGARSRAMRKDPWQLVGDVPAAKVVRR